MCVCVCVLKINLKFCAFLAPSIEPFLVSDAFLNWCTVFSILTDDLCLS